MKLSIIMPVYNEIGTIAEILQRVRAVRLKVPVGYGPDDGTVVEFEREVVIVDDGSTDGTREILRALEDESDLRLVFHEHNQGKGAAVRTGLQHASGEVMLVQDADLEYDPRDYLALLQPIIEGRSQVVYGSRFRGGPTKAMFFWHMIGNRGLTLVTNVLYNTILSDMETCYKVLHGRSPSSYTSEHLAGVLIPKSQHRSSGEATASTRCLFPTQGGSLRREKRSVGVMVWSCCGR